jgi:fluoroquinolone resistance protein
VAEVSSEFYDEVFDAAVTPEFKLEGREFHDCKFIGYPFSGVSLAHSKFVECKFTRCDLSNSSVSGTSFRSVGFHESKLIGIDWTRARTLLFMEFVGSVLSYSNFVGLDLVSAKLKGCVAHEALFTGANLSKADCTETDFRNSQFNGANLSGADFRRARDYFIRPDSCNLKKARFSLPEATTLLYGLDIVLDDS